MKTHLIVGLGTLGAWVALMGLPLFNSWGASNVTLSGFDLLVGQPPEWLHTSGYKVGVWVATIALLGISIRSLRIAMARADESKPQQDK